MRTTDDDSDVDANDDWEHYAYDERWRALAMFLNDDSASSEDFVMQAAGLNGTGAGSGIDSLVLRDRDTTGNGVHDERIFYCQNWRHDVIALVSSASLQVEMVRYSGPGVPFGLPAGDVDSDGHCIGSSEIQGLSQYDVLADLDLDGDHDVADEDLAASAILGRSNLSSAENDRGARSMAWALARFSVSGTGSYYSTLLGVALVRAPRPLALSTNNAGALQQPTPSGTAPQEPGDGGWVALLDQDPTEPVLERVILDGTNNCSKPDQQGCLEPGQNSDDIGVDDPDMVYGCGQVECFRLRIRDWHRCTITTGGTITCECTMGILCHFLWDPVWEVVSIESPEGAAILEAEKRCENGEPPIPCE